MVEVTEDQNTAEQVYQSFKEVADGKPYVTEIDLRHSLVGEEVIARMAEMVPEHTGVEAKEDRGLRKFNYVGFMEGLLCGEGEGQGGEDRMMGGENGSGSGGKALREVVGGGNRGVGLQGGLVGKVNGH